MQYAYGNYLAIMHADGDWQTVEGMQSKVMATVGEYLQRCKLSSVLQKQCWQSYLNNKEDKRELKVNQNNTTLPFCSEPTYLRGMLDRTVTYRWYLKSLRK